MNDAGRMPLAGCVGALLGSVLLFGISATHHRRRNLRRAIVVRLTLSRNLPHSSFRTVLRTLSWKSPAPEGGSTRIQATLSPVAAIRPTCWYIPLETNAQLKKACHTGCSDTQ